MNIRFYGFLRILVVFVFGIVFSGKLFCMNFFLQAPEKVKLERKKRNTSMSWTMIDQGAECLFEYDEEAGVRVTVFLEEFPCYIDKEQENLFKKLEKKYKNFSFVYEYGSCSEEERNENGKKEQGSDESAVQSGKSMSYCAGKILSIKDRKPKEIFLGDLAEYIKTKNVVFYTGAGISAASDVFTMDQLECALGICTKERKRSLKNFLLNLAKDPKKVANAFEGFCKAMFNNLPTRAHEDLLKIANNKKCKIVTENLDSLHQKTGIEPYTIYGKKFRREIKNEWAKDIDAIICCGLSHDDRGFLGWYKEHNPNGTIMAIDIGKPNYLSDQDFLLQGDLQEVIPNICDDLGI